MAFGEGGHRGPQSGYRPVNSADSTREHFEAARIKLMLYDAVEIKIIGDAYMAVFRTADDALQFALNFRADTGDPQIAIRVGIHVGPPPHRLSTPQSSPTAPGQTSPSVSGTSPTP